MNTLAVHLLNSGLTSSDLLFVPELIAELEVASTVSPYQQWFYAAPGTAGQDSSPEIDLDLDGLTNLLEFAFGGSPAIAQTTALTPSITDTQFHFRRRVDHTSAGLTYTIEKSNSLRPGSWTPQNGLPIVSASEDPDIEIVSMPLPVTSERIFYRLRVELE